MGKRGPVPMPDNLRVLRGMRPRAEQGVGVKLPPAALVEPDWAAVLPGSDPQVLADCHTAWDEVVPPLVTRGVVASVDRPLVVDYCVCRARILECERQIAKHGISVATERGWARNPALTAVSQYRAAAARYTRELGIGPASRSDLKAGSDSGSEMHDILD